MSPVALALFALGFVDAFEVGRHLELNLRVIESFEHGPVILEASITNRGTRMLIIDEFVRYGHCLVWPLDDWNLRERRPPFCRLGSGLYFPLRPGQTYTERHSLHTNFRSRFPAGTHPVEATWMLATPYELKRDGESIPVPGPLMAFASKTFPVTISPATPANRYALAARLEAEFAALPPVSHEADDRDSPLWELCERVTHTPHKELIPLALRLLDSLPDRLRSQIYVGPAADLVEMVFDADPAAAHRIFVDRLTASPPSIHPGLVMPVWWEAVWKFRSNLWDLALPLDPRFWNDRRWRAQWVPHKQLLELVRWLPESSPRILPEAEFRRLIVAKDFWVRAWLFYDFRDRLTPDWNTAFLAEAKRWANAAPDANAPKVIDRGTDLFLDILSYDRVAGGKLLDIFAAGNVDNPVCWAARQKVAERTQREREREREQREREREP